MIASLLPQEQEHFVGLLHAIGEGDGVAAANHVLAFSERQPRCHDSNAVAAFQRDVESFFAEHCRGYGAGIDLGIVLRGILGIVRTHGVRIDVNYATLVMNALCLDGLATSLSPKSLKYNVMDAAAPLLRAHHRWKWLERFPAGRGLLHHVALPLAMARKRRQDNAVNRRISREHHGSRGELTKN
jgi:aarF domain-containing kinase